MHSNARKTLNKAELKKKALAEKSVWGICGKTEDEKPSLPNEKACVSEYLSTEEHTKTERLREFNWKLFRWYWMTQSLLDHSHKGTHRPAT